MKTLATLSASSLILLAGANAFAQEAPPATEEGPPDQAPPPAPSQDQTQTPAQPTSPAPQAGGQWVYTAQYGWVWVPSDASTTTVGEQPYAYLYTPSYGWTWYNSPWGFGAPYFYGPRVWGHPYFGGRPYRYAPGAVLRPNVWVGPRVGAPYAVPHGGGVFHGGGGGFHGGGGGHGGGGHR
jgi:hypothetical protein